MPLFSIINVVLFQAGWFSAALLTDDSIFILLALLSVHCWMTPTKGIDLWTLLLVLPLGIASEALMVASSLLSYQGEWMVPAWMILLWALLVLTFNHALKWMQTISIIWQALLAGLAATGSYAAANSFGAIQVNEPQTTSLLIIGIVWAIQLPIMLWIARYLTQRGQEKPVEVSHENEQRK